MQGDYTEANAWQYSWTPLLHDPQGMIAALGGRPAFTAMLDRFFALKKAGAIDKYQGQEALIGQSAHGNEPSHHIAWAYAFSDTPEKGPALVRRIASQFYRDTPDGLTGNDDAGQMSAWYVFATLGIYPANPASGSYVAGLPLVGRAVIRIPGRNALTIAATGLGSGSAIVTLDGRRIDPLDISHGQIEKGGRLEFQTQLEK